MASNAVGTQRQRVVATSGAAVLSFLFLAVLLQRGVAPTVLKSAAGSDAQHGGWQTLSLWGEAEGDDRGRDAGKLEEPAWLKARKQLTTPHEEMDQAKQLRQRLSEADSALREAQNQLKRAEGQSPGAGLPHHPGSIDTVRNVRVSDPLPTWQPAKEQEPKLVISATYATNGQTVKVAPCLRSSRPSPPSRVLPPV